ncbi:MAG: hypothetical protein HYY09_01975, partial [Firmicutes bacterium]|nr:hypothetical protein [Bacillota bacterium]
ARRSAAPRRFPDPQDTKGLPAPQTLTQFLAGRAVLLGGVNPALAHYLNQTGDRLFPARPPAASSTRKAGEVRKGGQSGGTAGANGTSPWVFLPLPGPPGKQGLPVIGLGALVVFYQADFKGQPHTQAAVELARHLSRWRTEVPLGLFAGVPAYQDSMRSWITGIIGEAGTGGSSTGGSSSAGSSSAGTGSGGTGTSGTEPSAPAAAVRGRQTEQFAQGDQLPIDLYESFRKWGGLPEIVFPQVRVGLTALPRPALDADGARWLISELERAGKSGFTVYPTSEAGDLEAAVWHDLVWPAINAFWSGGLDATQFAGQIAAAVDRRKDVANGDN